MKKSSSISYVLLFSPDGTDKAQFHGLSRFRPNLIHSSGYSPEEWDLVHVDHGLYSSLDEAPVLQWECRCEGSSNDVNLPPGKWIILQYGNENAERPSQVPSGEN